MNIKQMHTIQGLAAFPLHYMWLKSRKKGFNHILISFFLLMLSMTNHLLNILCEKK